MKVRRINDSFLSTKDYWASIKRLILPTNKNNNSINRFIHSTNGNFHILAKEILIHHKFEPTLKEKVMKNLITILLIAITLVGMFNSCKKENIEPTSIVRAASGCVESPTMSSAAITKKQGPSYLNVGVMNVWNDNDFIYVQLIADNLFDNSKLYIGPCSSVPTVVTSNNIDHDPEVNTYTYVFPNTYSAGDEICISSKISGNRLSNLSHVIEDICDCNIDLGDFRTQSKGGWGANPNGGNNATYMYNNWDAIGSLTIGCGSTTMSFLLPEDVTTYLPNGNNVDYPFNSNLATQTLALSISLALDNGVANFGASENNLACLILDSSDPELAPFNGINVGDLLILANEVLGGCNTSYSFAEMTHLMEALNLNFHSGDTDNGHLTCGDCN